MYLPLLVLLYVLFSPLSLACPLNDDVLQVSVLDPFVSPYMFPLRNLIHSPDLSKCHYISTMPRSPVLISRLSFKSDTHLSTGLLQGDVPQVPCTQYLKLIVEELFLGL